MKPRAVIIAATVLLLTGCGSGDTLPEADYYDLVRETEGLSGMQDENLADLGEKICAAFEADPDAYVPVLKEMLDSGMDGGGQAGPLIAFSLAQYCPAEVENIPGQ